MGWISRIFRKENPANRSIFTTISTGTPLWTTKNYAALAEAGYQNCSTGYACVSTIAKTASRIEWILEDRQGNEVEESPLLELLERPNENESGVAFVEKVFNYILIAGNSYIAKVHGMPSLPPKYLYTLRPDRTKVIPGTWDKPIRGYEYNAGSSPVTFKGEDVLHLKEFHPTDDFYGLSRMEVASRQIDVSNTAMEWNKKLLQNDMRPAGVMNFEDSLTEDQRTEFRKQVEYRSSGYGNAGKFLITEGKAKWEQMSVNPKDVDWINGQKLTMRLICSIFGVPSMLLGDTEATTYNNYQEARKALYEETVLPLMDILTDELNYWLVPLFGDGLELSYDRDSIEALQEERGKKYSYLAQADWLTINDKRDATGYEPLEEGDVLLVPFSVTPLEQAVEEPEPPAPASENPPPSDESTEPPPKEAEEEEGEDESATGEKARPRPNQSDFRGGLRVVKAHKKRHGKSYWTERNRRVTLWHSFDQRIKARSKSFTQIARKYLMRQATELVDKIGKLNNLQEVKPEVLFNVQEETKRYYNEFKGWYIDHFIRAGNAGLKATKGELFDDAEEKRMVKAGKTPPKWTFVFTPKKEEELMRMVFNSGTLVNESTIDIIYETLHASMRDNATIEQFTQQIWEQVDEFSPARARLWAETESTKVENWGTLEGYEQNPDIEIKGWNCQILDTSREEHIEADGQEVPLDEPFLVGGEELMFPGDHNASAWNVCNCRCSMYPVTDSDAWVNR